MHFNLAYTRSERTITSFFITLLCACAILFSLINSEQKFITPSLNISNLQIMVSILDTEQPNTVVMASSKYQTTETSLINNAQNQQKSPNITKPEPTTDNPEPDNDDQQAATIPAPTIIPVVKTHLMARPREAKKQLPTPIQKAKAKPKIKTLKVTLQKQSLHVHLTTQQTSNQKPSISRVTSPAPTADQCLDYIKSFPSIAWEILNCWLHKTSNTFKPVIENKFKLFINRNKSTELQPF